MQTFILTAIVFAGLALLIYMGFLAFEENILEQELRFSNFPKSFGTLKIFFISDIHKRKLSEQFISKAKGKADIVIIGGDLKEKGVPIKRVKENVEMLNTIGPVYFVWGNNDYEGDYRELDALLLDLKVKILDNTAALFESKTGDKLTLLGVDDVGLEKDRLDFALSDAERGWFTILASHNPKIIEKITPEDNISLVLSGHTHGGQIRIFGFGPYKKGGIEERGGTILLTSNGYGTTGIPFRLGARAESHLLSIRNQEKNSIKRIGGQESL
ncbi:metallophosphoesterase [Neobacillus notoginsengisoli]|uniref:Metallophosphoesterase n=1 Tax=Neobacillus notoginsengisoli TaxID=1578198 RepID=A0A417YVI8_9BACI|nr:metallophosphoesterase [Neobacillus notoginsengisoli]RHW41222.1 metallophosphoesterase [Neobacillus notoginsengisoli]